MSGDPLSTFTHIWRIKVDFLTSRVNFFLKNRGRPSQSKVKATHVDNTQTANPQYYIECKTETQNVFFRFLSQNEKKVVLLHPLSRGKESQNGLLAQLVQSASFTRKRSTVRICNRPPQPPQQGVFLLFQHSVFQQHPAYLPFSVVFRPFSTNRFFMARLQTIVHSSPWLPSPIVFIWKSTKSITNHIKTFFLSNNQSPYYRWKIPRRYTHYVGSRRETSNVYVFFAVWWTIDHLMSYFAAQ